MVLMYLELCTSNLTPNTIDDLVMENINGIVAYTYEEGMFIIVPDKSDFCFDYDLNELPTDLLKLLEYTWKNNISIIRLDRKCKRHMIIINSKSIQNGRPKLLNGQTR